MLSHALTDHNKRGLQYRRMIAAEMQQVVDDGVGSNNDGIYLLRPFLQQRGGVNIRAAALVDFGIVDNCTPFYQGIAKQGPSAVAANDQNASSLHLAKQRRGEQTLAVRLLSSGEMMLNMMLLEYVCSGAADGEYPLMMDADGRNGEAYCVGADEYQIIILCCFLQLCFTEVWLRG